MQADGAITIHSIGEAAIRIDTFAAFAQSAVSHGKTGARGKKGFVAGSLLLYAILLLGLTTTIQAEMADTIIARKKTLSAKLDSLELHKQARKRQGLPLDTLERQGLALKDSIERLRDSLASAIANGGFPAAGKKKGFSFAIDQFKPTSFFDWAIAAVAAIAVLCALLLIIGILQTIVARRKKNGVRRSRPAAVSKTARQRIHEVSRAESSPESDNKEEEGLEAIRKSMNEDIERIQRFNRPEESVLQAPAASAPVAADEVHGKIVAAASQGINEREIARRHNVSIDQVRLVLRVAGKDPSR